MTLDEIRTSDRIMLTAADIAPILGSDPQTIRQTAKDYPERIGYPFSFVGSRMKIPRLGFIRWVVYGNAPIYEKEVESIGSDTAT